MMQGGCIGWSGHRHNDIDNDTQGDEQLGERIKNDNRKYLCCFDPELAAIPDAGYADALLQVITEYVFKTRSFVIVILSAWLNWQSR